MKRCVEIVFMKKLISSICLFFSLVLSAQQIPLGEWRSHLSYTRARIVEQAGTTIFCASKNGLFTVNTETNAITKISKSSGAGDVTVTAIHYASQASAVIIGYESGVVDIISDDGDIVSLTSLRDSPLVGERAVQDIASVGEKAYLATDLGVILLDIPNQRLVENYRNIGPAGETVKPKEVMIASDTLLVITENGIQSGLLADNLLDFNAWTFYDETNGQSFRHLVRYNDQNFVLKDAVELWQLVGTSWQAEGTSLTTPARDLFATANNLLALTEEEIYTLLPSSGLLFSHASLTAGESFVSVSLQSFWVADSAAGLLKISGNQVASLIPSGPLSDAPTRLEDVNGSIYALFGPTVDAYDGTADELGYSLWQDGSWQQEELDNFYNLTDVDELNGALYFTGLGFGLHNASTGNTFNVENAAFSDEDELLFTSAQSFGNALWVTSYDNETALYSFREDNDVTSFASQTIGSRYPLDIIFSTDGILWMIRDNVEGLGASAYDPATDDQRTFTTTDGLPASSINQLAIDRNDQLWFATSSGPATYQPASFPFNDFGVSIPFFDNAILFENEFIFDMIIDGGNRPWFATDRGVWVLSADLNEIIHRFITENSPLPSNEVRAMEYLENSGEVFIQTTKGIVSYRSVSSVQKEASSSIKVFPNPVDPGFSGQVGFSGVAPNATLKITDVKGRLVAEINANGSTASWNLQTFNGGRAAAGVYLIFSSLADGSEGLVGKIAVLE